MQHPILRTALLIIFLVYCQTAVFAQFGVRIKYNSNNYKNWQNSLENKYSTDTKMLSPGYELGVDYWFRLKKKRIEFMPELYYSTAKTSYSNAALLQNMEATTFGFNFHAQIYALDLEGDCDCPTFSKGGSGIDKGLFFHFTPGIFRHTTRATFDPISSFAVNPVNHIGFKAGVGVGIDFGISDFLTLTPIVSYYFNSAMAWDEFLQSKVNLSQLQFTMRLGFRPDYSRKRRR